MDDSGNARSNPLAKYGDKADDANGSLADEKVRMRFAALDAGRNTWNRVGLLTALPTRIAEPSHEELRENAYAERYAGGL